MWSCVLHGNDFAGFGPQKLDYATLFVKFFDESRAIWRQTRMAIFRAPYHGVPLSFCQSRAPDDKPLALLWPD